MQAEVRRRIEDDLPVKPVDDNHICIGNDTLTCTGGRTHVKSTGQIQSFRLLPRQQANPITGAQLLVGIVGDVEEEAGFDRVLKAVG